MRPLVVIGLFLTTAIVAYATVMFGYFWYTAPELYHQTVSNYAFRIAPIVSIALGLSAGITVCILGSFRARA